MESQDFTGLDLTKHTCSLWLAPYLGPCESGLLEEEGWKGQLEQQKLSAQGRSGSLEGGPGATGHSQSP